VEVDDLGTGIQLVALELDHQRNWRTNECMDVL